MKIVVTMLWFCRAALFCIMQRLTTTALQHHSSEEEQKDSHPILEVETLSTHCSAERRISFTLLTQWRPLA